MGCKDMKYWFKQKMKLVKHFKHPIMRIIVGNVLSYNEPLIISQSRLKPCIEDCPSFGWNSSVLK
jgi:hypothetical protein